LCSYQRGPKGDSNITAQLDIRHHAVQEIIATLGIRKFVPTWFPICLQTHKTHNNHIFHHSCFDDMMTRVIISCSTLWLVMKVSIFWPRNKMTEWHHMISPKKNKTRTISWQIKLQELCSGILRASYWLIFCQKGKQCISVHSDNQKTVMCTS
jgi:hypothetical protein